MTLIIKNRSAAVSVRNLSSLVEDNEQCIARFKLRKRAVRDYKDIVNLSSYNSDFLLGLFADVEQAKVLSELGVVTDDDSSHTPPNKRSKISHDNHIVENLIVEEVQALSDPSKGLVSIFNDDREASIESQDSLAHQLNFLSGSLPEGGIPCGTVSSNGLKNVVDVVSLAFPHLPATVSDSSCSAGITRATLDRHVSNPENDLRECFGWFVDLDNDHAHDDFARPYLSSTDDLTFKASTAPKRVHDDAELEWAQAADTVDDVLGDFF